MCFLVRKEGVLFTILLTVTVLLGQIFFGLQALGGDQTDGLFPEKWRPEVYFHGEITSDIQNRLEMLPHAEAMNTLNVLRGNGGDLMLDRTANRMEGATMLVRLLGAEKEALDQNYGHPFTDVASWADPYVGYLYKNGLTNGIGDYLYGSELSIDEKSYLTFLLRALGYSDRNGKDFTWDTVEQTARDASLLTDGEVLADGTSLKRERLSELSWRAMFLSHKIQNQSLIVFLYQQGMITGANVERLIMPQALPLVNQWFSCFPPVENAFIHHEEEIELIISEEMSQTELQKYLAYVLERVQITTGVFYKGYSSELWQEGEEFKLYIHPRYVNTLEQDQRLFAMIDEIGKMIFKPEMTEYEMEKAAHQFLIDTLVYDTRTEFIEEIPESSFHALGALETGTAVCRGYAELMALLMNRVGIPCRIVAGVADGVSHAWNIVLLDGKSYHVDVTWDDPVNMTGENTLRYDYFNVTDMEMMNSHVWEVDDYPACYETSENYYVKNNLVIDEPDNFYEAIKKVVQNGDSKCQFKLKNMETEDMNIETMMNDINKESDYKLVGYTYSFNEDMQVIRFGLLEYR